MFNVMKPYIDLGKEILADSNNCEDRTGAGTYSTFGKLLEFDTRLGSPFLTERKLPLRSITGELLWFLEGSVNVDVLRDDYKCSFWNEWACDKTRTIGPMYGQQWRNARGVDQLARLIKGAIDTPNSRRLLVNTWIPDLIPNESNVPSSNPENGIMALPPCHFSYQLRLYDDHSDERSAPRKWVDLMFHLRSSDYFLGLPSNIASYHMLQAMIASYLTKKTEIQHTPRYLKASLGDVHIYRNHVEACEELFQRKPSKSVPKYAVSHVMLERYLNLKTEGKFDKSERTVMLNSALHGISDYVPGKVIKGARNV